MDSSKPVKNIQEYKKKAPKKGADLSSYVFGKVQPQAVPLEEAVLGAIMLNKETLPIVVDILRPESFYVDAHQMIYKAMLGLFEKSQPVDLLTVTEALKQAGDLEKAGGPYYIVELTNKVASSANIEYHAKIVAQKHIQRELINVSTTIIRDAFEDTTDVFELMDSAERNLFSIMEKNLSRGVESMGALSSRLLKQLETLAELKTGLTGIPTGFSELDRLTSGWQSSDLIIIAARPGMGKTAFTLAMARNAAVDFKRPVAVFSLEMSSLQLVQRLISLEAEISGSKLRNGQMEEYEWQQLQSVIEKMSEAPIFIDDTPGINIFEIRAKCRRLKMQHDIQLVIIDYLQLMSGVGNNPRGSREQEVSAISRSLKSLAKELNVPVIALSQLSRAVEVRGGTKRPQLSDLRESGCLTGDTLLQDAVTGKRYTIKELAERDLQIPIRTQSLGEDMKVKGHAMTKAFYSGRKRVFELTTKSGRTIKASANHPFLTLEGWQPLENLNKGDRIAVPKQLQIENPANRLSEQQLQLYAQVIGTSSFERTYNYHSDRQEEIVGRIIDDVPFDTEQLFTDYHAAANPEAALSETTKHTQNLYYSRRTVQLERVSLPEGIFSCSDDKIAFFLQHLWAYAGEVKWKKKKDKKHKIIIEYCTDTATIAHDVQHLLIRLGIRSFVKIKQRKNKAIEYRVSIRAYKDQALFMQIIGCQDPKELKNLRLFTFIKSKEEQPRYDSLPKEVWNTYIKSAIEKAGITWSELFRRLRKKITYSVRRAGVSKKRLKAINTILKDDNIRKLTDSDVHWDKIISIIPLGIQDVYDATVPDVHNFVANDIVVHNSIEQDADIVSFIYRPEYYQIMEDEEGQSLKGIAEIIVAKHRNGALKTVKLRFVDKFAKFMDIEDPDFNDLPDFNDPGQNVITRSSRMNEDEDVPF